MPRLLYIKPHEIESLLKFNDPQDQLGSDFCYVNATATEDKIFSDVTETPWFPDQVLNRDYNTLSL